MPTTPLAIYALEDPRGTLLALFQLLVLSLTAVGWGFWIRKLSGGKLRLTRADHILCALAGWAACILFLQNLVYCGLRVAWSAWLAVAIALAGLFTFAAEWLKETPAPHWIRNTIPISIAALAVALFQGAALWKHGAHNYYGTGHQDHANYVQLAQFLIEKPFDMRIEDVGLEPWTIKAIDTKDMRIAQSVANAYVAAACGTDAKSGYGPVVVFSIAFLALAVYTLLRNLGLSVAAAALAASWAGALPIITHTHLDGFFSQTFVLGILPALVASVWIAPRHSRLAGLAGGLLAGLLLNGYTEIYIIGVAFLVVGYLGITDFTLGQRATRAILLPVAAILCVPAFIPRFTAFISLQYRVAASPLALADLVPKSGTWEGWSEMFFGQASAQPLARAELLGGFGILALVGFGTLSMQSTRRLRLLLFLTIPAGLLALLLSAPAFPKYAFAKLLASFSPLIVSFASLGLWRFAPSLSLFAKSLGRPFSILGRRRIGRIACLVASTGLLFTSVPGSARMLDVVCRNEGIISTLNSPQSRRIYRELEDHPGRCYLLNEPHNILNAWFAYHARHSSLYVNVDLLGDRPVPSTAFSFRRPPEGKEMPLLNRYGVKSAVVTSALPDILVRNPQGIEGDQDLTFYWIGDEATFEIHHFSRKPADFILSLRAMAGLANPSPRRLVALISNRDVSLAEKVSFAGDTKLHFRLHLLPGQNTYTFRVLEPTEWRVKIPTDPRKHMIRIQELSITRDVERK